MTTKIATLIPEVSKRARRELGLSQNDVIKATGVQAYKLKQWEARGLSLDLVDLHELSNFYESQGIDLVELVAHIGRTEVGLRESSPHKVADSSLTLQAGFTYTPRPGFIISDHLAPELVNALMERMESNDDRIAELTAETFRTSFFGSISDDSEAKARELVGTLAENHVIFRSLQGRNIVSMSHDEPKTIGEYLGKMLEASPVFLMIASEPETQRATKAAPVTIDSEG